MPKGSFYHHFASKEEFAVAVIECYSSWAHRYTSEFLGKTRQAPLKHLRRYSEHLIGEVGQFAEKAGVRVGSVYQYFPNKASILFKLQSGEWQQTTEMLRSILKDVRKPSLQRLRLLVHTFIRSECKEAGTRVALNDAAPLYRDAPEVQEAKVSVESIFQAFMREILPKAPSRTRALAGELMTMTLGTVGKNFSETPRTPAEIRAYAKGMADMFCAYLRELAHP